MKLALKTMFLLDQVKQTDLIVPSVDYNVFIKDNVRIELPGGILTPIIMDHDGFTQQTLDYANLRPGMNLLEILSKTRRATRALTFSRMTQNARDLHGSVIDTFFSPETINGMFDIFDNYTTEELIGALISEYPLPFGAAVSMTPEQIAKVTADNMSWTLKAMTETYNHMKRVSRFALKIITYIAKTYSYDTQSREILESILIENDWGNDPETLEYLLPLIILGMGYAGEVHDAGKGRILQVIYQPKALTAAERDIVDRHVLLSINIAETFKKTFDYVLLLHAPHLLGSWEAMHNYAMRVIAEHHPERTGRHTTSGDILATADVFDVITQIRIYKLSSKKPAEALAEMTAIPHLNQKIVALFAKCLNLNLPVGLRF